MALQNIFINRCEIEKFVFDNIIDYFSQNQYNEESEEGFYVSCLNDDYVEVHYISYTVSYENKFDFENYQFIREEYRKAESTRFVIDYLNQITVVWGNKAKTVKILELIGKISNYKVVTDEIYITPVELFKKLSSHKISYNIRRIKIKEYQFFDGVFGDCSLNLTDYSKSNDIIKEYALKISQVTINIYIEENYTLTFYESGAITIYKEYDDICFAFIRKIISLFL
ncbi:hypothetical protein [Petroclostridium sp. X23]|uniref:hypothetical protein n=1 Tax=Petroclostridium sp. X23 TaxID=3045146 RepID=UPI0024ACC77B|nr:hypothetical protein [Petroclostridium sp. X23]WHH59186.1 hypothetical protein QKW49_25930 [Petroclostridium sp. X23]